MTDAPPETPAALDPAEWPRVVADDRWIAPHGIGRYAAEVLRRLPAYTPTGLRTHRLAALDPWRVQRVMRRLRPEVYWSPGYNPPARLPCPFVFSVHDLIPLRLPGPNVARRLYFHGLVRPALQRAAAIVTVSQHVAGQLVAELRAPAQRIHIVPPGVSAVFTPDGPVADADQPYFLYVGPWKPHKNVPGLLQAFADAALPDVRLHVTGDATPAATRLIERHGLADRVRFLGTVDDAALARQYRGAIALVLPSLDEGFGIPPLEAMACGTPAVALDIPAVREATGGAAVIVEPADLSDALRRLHADASWRGALIEPAIEHASRYVWDDTAARIAAILRAAAQAQRP